MHIRVAYPRLAGLHGGAGVTIWTLQALRDAGFRVSLASLALPEPDLLNGFFGTNVRLSDIELEIAPAWVRLLISALPTPASFLRMSLLERHVARLRPADLVISTNNEMRLPAPGVQYLHYPRLRGQRPREDYRWFHRPPGFLSAYRRLSALVSGPGLLPASRNLTLANSAFIAGLAAPALAGIRVVHPPVHLPGANGIPWSEKAACFAAVGRIHVTKRVLEMIEILRRVRERGHAFDLVLAGEWDCPSGYRRRVEARLARHPWIRLAGPLSRSELAALLARSRFGLHAMIDEHFGMGVAEMQSAGAVVFAHNSGGPREILGGEPRQLYDSDDQAVEKIDTVLRDDALCHRLREDAARRAGNFSAERFCREMLDAAALFRHAA